MGAAENIKVCCKKTNPVKSRIRFFIKSRTLF